MDKRTATMSCLMEARMQKKGKVPTYISLLLKFHFARHRGRNLLAAAAIAVSVLLLFGSLGILRAKYNLDLSTHIKESGCAASASITNAGTKTEKKAKALPYIKETGTEKRFGTLRKDGSDYASGVAIDRQSFADLYEPAFLHMSGSYPTGKDEVLLSRSMLDILGIRNPRIGMRLDLEIHWETADKNPEQADINPEKADESTEKPVGNTEKTGGSSERIGGRENVQEGGFRLSGIYTGYDDGIAQTDPAFFSKELLRSEKLSFYPARLLLVPASGQMHGTQMEKQLRADLLHEGGQEAVTAADSPACLALEGIRGSLAGYAGAVAVMILCLFLLILNVVGISLGSDEQYYKTLGRVGATTKQIQIAISLWIWLLGSVGWAAGSVLGVLVTAFVLPGILKQPVLFHPAFLLISAVCGCLMLALLSGACTFKYRRMTQSTKRRLSKRRCKKVSRGTPGRISKREYTVFLRHGSTVSLARRYLFADKKQLLLFAVSLGMGILLMTVLLVLSGGLDMYGRYAKRPDFQISLTKEMLARYPFQHSGTSRVIGDHTAVTDNMLDEVAHLAHIDRDRIRTSGGKIAAIDDVPESEEYGLTDAQVVRLRRDRAFSPIRHNRYAGWIGTRVGYHGRSVICAVPPERLDALFACADKQGLHIGRRQFTDGWGALIVHDHILSKKKTDAAIKSTGKKLYLYPVKENQTDKVLAECGTLVNLGYLDATGEGVPTDDMIWRGKNTLYFFVSEETLSKLTVLPKQTFRLSFDVAEKREGQIKSALRRWVLDQNAIFQKEEGETGNFLRLSCKSDLVAKTRVVAVAVGALMHCLCAAAGILVAVTFAGRYTAVLTSRKKEYRMLIQIGAKRKQLVGTMLLEGCGYWLLGTGITGIVGSVITSMLNWIMPDYAGWFHAYYPWRELLIVEGVWLLLGLGIPWLFGRESFGAGKKQ